MKKEEMLVSEHTVEVEERKPITFKTKVAEITNTKNPHKINQVEEIWVEWIWTETIEE